MYMSRYKFTKASSQKIIADHNGDGVDLEMLQECINTFEYNHKEKYITLNNYYKGYNDIYKNNTKVTQDSANWKLPSPSINYIVTYHTGYLLNDGVVYNSDSNEFSDFKDYLDGNNSDEAVNREIVRDFLLYGVAYDIVYVDDNLDIKYKSLDPINTFCVFNSSLDQKMIWGCRLFSKGSDDFVEVYTESEIYTFKRKGSELSSFGAPKTHHFQGIPITMYNRNDMMSLVEGVLPFVDAYDAVLSDLTNFISDSSNAVLFMKGITLPNAPKVATPCNNGVSSLTGAPQGPGSNMQQSVNTQFGLIKQMQQMKIFIADRRGSDGIDPDLRYVSKAYDVEGIKFHLQTIKREIYSSTATPDLNDSTTTMGGSNSGIAIGYRDMQTNNVRLTNERTLITGLRRRLKLAGRVFNVKNIKAGSSLYESINKLKIKCPRPVFETTSDILNNIKMLEGSVSKQTILEMASKVTGIDAYEEIERLKSENGIDNPVGNNHLIENDNHLQPTDDKV